MGHLAVVQVEEVRRGIVGFKHGKVFGAEMRVDLLAGQDRKEKRQVRIVGLSRYSLRRFERVVAGHRGEVGVELVVGLDEEAAVRIGEDAR